MNLKLKNIILPSEITKQKVVISLTVVAIAIGGLFYFITKDDAMPAAVKEKTAIVVINDNANSAKINQIINKEENASDDKIDSIISSKQPTSHVLIPIIKISLYISITLQIYLVSFENKAYLISKLFE